MKTLVSLSALLLAAISGRAQSVGINIVPAATAALDVASSSKGILIPRMSTTSRTAISGPAKGLMVYDSTVNNFYYYNGSAWTAVGGSSGGGTTLPAQTGNAGKVLETDGTNLSWQQVTPLFVKKTTAQLINTTSPSYAGVISINLEANQTYLLYAQVFGYRATATSAPYTFRLKYSGTASTDLGVTNIGSVILGTAFNSTGTHDLEAAGFVNSATATNAQRYELRTYLTTTSAGTFTIEAARATTNTSFDFYVSQGSYITATQL